MDPSFRETTRGRRKSRALRPAETTSWQGFPSYVELDAQPALIHVRRTWDHAEGEAEVKTDAGLRVVPVTAILRRLLVAHRAPTRRRPHVRADGSRSVHPLHGAEPRAEGVGLEGDSEPGAGRAQDITDNTA